MLAHIYKHRLAYLIILGTILCVFGCVILMMGFWVAPVGEIASSVLVAVGEVFTFAGSLMGISATYQTKLQKLKEDLKHD